MASIPYDCWGIVLSYTSNQRKKEAPSDRSQCALTCRHFYQILRENSSARLLSSTPIPQHKEGILVADSVDGSLRAWVGNTLQSPTLSIERHGQLIGQIRLPAFPEVAFTPDQASMALSCAGFASVYRLLPLVSGRLLSAQPCCRYTIAISPNGEHVALGSTQIYRTEPETYVCQLDERAAPLDPVAFSPDGRRLVSASQYAKIIKIWAWQRSTNRSLYNLRLQATPKELAISPDNRFLAIIYESGQVALLRIKNTETIWTLNYPDSPSYIGFGENRVVTITTPNRITVWGQFALRLNSKRRSNGFTNS